MTSGSILRVDADPLLPRVAALESAMPSPASTAPPAIADNSATGSTPTRFAMADHTHQSQVRKIRIQTAADGTITWTYSDKDGNALPFASGVIPRIQCIAETGVGVTDVYNPQVEGVPTNVSVKIRVARTQQSVVGLIGLTVLSVPASVGVTRVHIQASAP